MTRKTLCLVAPLGLLIQAGTAIAQDAGEAGDGVGLEDAIIVTAERIRGQVNAPQAPVAVLDEEEISTIGAGSIAELIEEIAPQTGSGRGRGGGHPAFLVNGQRISGFRELRNYPPEALERVEVLPEEVALRFGFPADQRVVNFILKDNYSSLTAEIDYGWPSDGGFATNELEASLLRIDGANRLNLAVETDDSSGLTEAERGVTSYSLTPLAGDADPAAFRSLIADSREIQVNANVSRALGEDGLGGSLSVNAAASRADSLSLRGPDLVTLDDGDESVVRTLYAPTLGFGPRTRDTKTETAELGATLNKPLGDWQMTATARWVHEEGRTQSDNSLDTDALEAAVVSGQIAATAPVEQLLAGGLVASRESERAITNTESATSLVTLVGQPLLLPAGEMSLTLKAGYDWDDIQSRDTRNPGIVTSLRRGDINGGFTAGIPIASRREGILDAIGDVTLDLSGGVRHLSDFGTLYDASAGLNWDVTRKLGLQVSYIYREEAPSLSQLGAPQILTSGATVYDFTNGTTALVDVLSGGNTALVAEKQSDWKIGLNWEFPVLDRSRFIAEYFDETSTNVSSSFPVLTPAIEAAFPGRVLRDTDGMLVSIDQRPITFARQTGRRLRYGFDVSDRISGKEAEGGEQRRRGPGFGRGGRSGGRWSLALYHTIRFDESVLIADGGPILDLLNGDALTSTPTPRHEIEMRGGIYYNGFGLRLSGEYLGASNVDGTGQPGSSSLRFHPVATFDARMFVDLDRQTDLVDQWGFLKGSRVSFRIDNIFNAQQRVTDDTGAVPLGYGPDFIDPEGRLFEIEFRKRF